MKPRVRFAPSPTGPLHIGGVRTALYNFLLARQLGGTFILRIEDTDQERFVPGAEDYITETLAWCGLQVDEGPHVGGPHAPYRQSERKPMYRQFAEQLLASGNAYYAFDTADELNTLRENTQGGSSTFKYDAATRMQLNNSLTLTEAEVKERLSRGDEYVIRLKVTADQEVVFEDVIRGTVSFQSNQLDDKVLLKSDGMPTYHMANVVDDHLMEITHVIRGEEWLPSAPTHVLLYRAFGWESTMPKFAHLPLILKPDGNGKLSKRDGDRLGFPVFSLDWTNPDTGEVSKGFRERGFLPEPFLNMLAFLGWNPGTEQEIFTTDELIAAFSLERINKAGAKFDFEKAKWFNQQYIKTIEPAELAKLVKPQLDKKGVNVAPEFLTEASRLLSERITFLNDFWEQGQIFFQPPAQYDVAMLKKKWKEGKKEFFPELVDRIEKLTDYTATALETEVKLFMETHSLGFGDVLPIIRIMLTGTMQGPAVFDTAVLIGREETLKRMRKGMAEFDGLDIG
ncbi:glutamate--tRNA ligase [soil metagenome]